MDWDPAVFLLPLLRRAGVHIAAGTGQDLLLKVPGVGAVRCDVKQSRRRLSHIGTLEGPAAGRRVLYAAPSATPGVLTAAGAGKIDLVVSDPEQVIIGGRVLLKASENEHVSARGRVGWGRQAILRVLALSSRPLRQRELATAIGISQQAVSLGLQDISTHTVREDNGWVAQEGALDAWLDSYAGPRGAVGYWYGLDDAATQSRSALRLLDDLDLRAVISGDLAADEYAPWQLPATVRMYLPEIIDFTPAGFAPATPDDATMTVVVPEDPTVGNVAAALARPYAGGHLLADAAITLWDLLGTSTASTADEAADHLREAIEAGGLGV